MVKVLIYSSKDIFDKSSFEGRAEAHIIAYRKDDGYYEIVKNRTGCFIGKLVATAQSLARAINWIEKDEWEQEMKDYMLTQRYKDHPNIELSKNAEVAQR